MIDLLDPEIEFDIKHEVVHEQALLVAVLTRRTLGVAPAIEVPTMLVDAFKVVVIDVGDRSEFVLQPDRDLGHEPTISSAEWVDGAAGEIRTLDTLSGSQVL